jgi:hypothetical protein
MSLVFSRSVAASLSNLDGDATAFYDSKGNERHAVSVASHLSDHPWMTPGAPEGSL